MIETLILLLLLALVLVTYKIFFTSKKNNDNHPPSPPSIPLLGHLHHLTPSLYKSFQSLSSKYGHLLLLRLGPSRRRLLLVSSASTAYHVFRSHDIAFSARPVFAFAERLPFGTSGFVTAPYGPYWRFMKKLCVTELLSARQLDRSKTIRREEIERSVRRVLHSAGETVAVDLGSEFMKFTNNVTCRMAMSTSCAEKSEDAERIRKLVKESFELAAKLCFGDVLGPFKELSFWVYGKKAIAMSTEYDELLEEVIKEHQHKRRIPSQRDLMDILLDVHHDAHAEFNITMTHIKAFFMDLFIAGTHTSAEATQWAMAELLNHPEAFQKLRKEIESVTATATHARLVDESDIPNLPYLQAVVKETLRLHPPAPITTRECRQHCKINGFDVPPKTAVAINLYAIMRDPDSWDNPNEFCPERFLQLEQDHHDEDFVPFGGGRRGCPGTALAFSFMHTAVAAMVQCFDWKIGEDGKGERVDMQSGSGLSLSMVHPLVCVPVVHFNPYDI